MSLPAGNAISQSVAFPTYPTLPNLHLSDEDASLVQWMSARLFLQRPLIELPGLYYDGQQRMQDLGISIPPQLKDLRTVVGWPEIGVNALASRCVVEGFRFPGASDVDDDVWGIWQANNLDSESQMAVLDALIYGRAYSVVGPGDDDTNGEPLITFESPLNMTAVWDPRRRRVSSAFSLWFDTDLSSDMYGMQVAALYLPDRTVHLVRQSMITDNKVGQWEVTDRDDHGLGYAPIARIANRQRLANRQGSSEIRASWRNQVDSACRTMLGMEVAREFTVAPRRYALGVTEESFQRPDGTPATAWETYINKVWMLERDAEGNVPTVGQFPGSDPAGFTKMLQQYQANMAAEMGLPPTMLGLHTQGNPASADAIREQYQELTSRATQRQIAFSDGFEDTMRLALLIRDGSVDPGAMRMETSWIDPAPQTLSGTTDAITKQVAAGCVPSTSDVVLKRLGYSAVERARLQQDMEADRAEQFLHEAANSVMVGVTRDMKALGQGATGEAMKDTTVAVAPETVPKKTPVPTPAQVFGGRR